MAHFWRKVTTKITADGCQTANLSQDCTDDLRCKNLITIPQGKCTGARVPQNGRMIASRRQLKAGALTFSN